MKLRDSSFANGAARGAAADAHAAKDNSSIKRKAESEDAPKPRKGAGAPNKIADELISDGKRLIPDSKKSATWADWVKQWKNDQYTFSILRAAMGVMKAMSGGTACGAALEAALMEVGLPLSLFQQGHVAQVVAHFYPDGKEYEKFWLAHEGRNPGCWPKTPLSEQFTPPKKTGKHWGDLA